MKLSPFLRTATRVTGLIQPICSSEVWIYNEVMNKHPGPDIYAPAGHTPLENEHRNISLNDLSPVARGIRYEEQAGTEQAFFVAVKVP